MQKVLLLINLPEKSQEAVSNIKINAKKQKKKTNQGYPVSATNISPNFSNFLL